MFLNDVLKKCKDEGYPITAAGLYFAGKKYGFLKKNDNDKSLSFDKNKFYDWLEKAKNKPPKNWVTLNELHNKLGISLSQAYILVKDPRSEAKPFGAGKGVLYVDPAKIKELIRQRKDEHRENWED